MPLPFARSRTQIRPRQALLANGAIKNEREDDLVLGMVEDTAVLEISAAFDEQWTAVQGVQGGATVEALTALWTAALLASSPALYDALLKAVEDALGVGAANAIAQGTALLSQSSSVSISWQLVAEAAKEFAEQYTFDLVKGINETTVKGLQNALSKWIESGGELSELTNSLRPFFDDTDIAYKLRRLFNVDRSELVATTEATRAYVEGKVRSYTEMGLADNPPEKRPVDDSHPGCRCDVGLVEDADDRSWWWVWYTARDDYVCDICWPRHLKRVGLAKAAPEDGGG